jgi:short-subunit dehydrogenase
MSNFPSKGVALITGASRGIGAVYADRLAKRGYDLILVARNEAGLRALSARLVRDTGARVEVLRADLTSKSDLARVGGTADFGSRRERIIDGLSTEKEKSTWPKKSLAR